MSRPSLGPRLALLALAGAFAGLAANEIAGAIDDAEPPPRVVSAAPSAANSSIAAASPPAAAQPGDEWEQEILARPVFSPSRRPPPPPPPVVAREAPPPRAPELRARLKGLMVSPARKEALFAQDNQKPIALTIGDVVDGWTVSAIGATSVTLSSAFGEKVVEPESGGRAARLAAQRARIALALQAANGAQRAAGITPPPDEDTRPAAVAAPPPHAAPGTPRRGSPPRPPPN